RGTCTRPRAPVLHGPGDQGLQANGGSGPMSLSSMSGARSIGRQGSLLLALLVTGANAAAQTAPSPAPPAQKQSPRPAYEKVSLTAGRSVVVPTSFNITRIAVTNAEIADAVVVPPREILVDGKKAGTVSLIVWSATGLAQYDVVVEPAITTLEQHLQTLFPGEEIAVSVSDEAIILSGQVSSTAVMLRAGEIAKASASKSQIINMLQVPGGTSTQLGMLQVRLAGG